MKPYELHNEFVNLYFYTIKTVKIIGILVIQKSIVVIKKKEKSWKQGPRIKYGTNNNFCVNEIVEDCRTQRPEDRFTGDVDLTLNSPFDRTRRLDRGHWGDPTGSCWPKPGRTTFLQMVCSLFGVYTLTVR